jgi:hypothetical protein
MAFTVAGNPDLTTKGFEKIFFDNFDKVDLKRKMFFRDIGKITGVDYKVSSFNNFNKWSAFTGTVNTNTAEQGYDVTLTCTEYADGYNVTQKMKDTDIYGTIKQLPAGLGEMGAVTIEDDLAAELFNEGFVTVRSGHTEGAAGTGQTLFNTAHTSSTGGATQGNYRTTTLSPTEMEAIRRVMVGWTDDKGTPKSFNPTMIMCNPTSAFYEVAFEIIGSSHKVDTDYNNVNFHQGRYKLVDWIYLDTDKFFVMDEKEMKKNLIEGTIHKTEFFKDRNSSTLQDVYGGYFNMGFQWIDWRGMHGSLV